MTSESRSRDVFVWVWLPGCSEPVVAGRVLPQGPRLDFVYGRSYLARADARSLYEPELPLRRDPMAAPPGLDLAGCLADALPDAWGRRVLLDRLAGRRGPQTRDLELDTVTLMLESGSNRAGALDFQASPDTFEPRTTQMASLEDLEHAAQRVDQGEPVPEELALALFHGSSIGGARPKATLVDGGRQLLAKFSSSNDTYDVVKAEFIAMRLARLAGFDVAEVSLIQANGRDVLLVERFDRVPLGHGWGRRAMVSALTVLGVHELSAHHTSYVELAEIVRHRFTSPRATLHQLFDRMVFNVLVGNTDDHARNHAAFWDGEMLSLTPAYDLCPQPRSGREANQAMCLMPGRRSSMLALCLESAPAFHLTTAAARDRIEALVDVVRSRWEQVCDEASLSDLSRRALAGRQILAPYAFEGFGPVVALR